MKIAELFAYLGVVADEKKAKDFFNILEGGKNIMFGLATMAVGSSIAIGTMLDKSLHGALALSQFEAQTGLSAQRLQEWQHVGESLGLTADGVTNSISSLNDKIQMIKITGEGGGPFARLGINPLEMKDAWAVLEKLRGVIKRDIVPRQIMSALVRQMGLGAEMIKVLDLSTEQFNKNANKGNIITKEQQNRAELYNQRLRKLGQTITYLFTKAFSELAPDAIRSIDDILGWLDENREDIGIAIKDITTNMGDVVKEIGTAFKNLDKIVKSAGGWDKVFDWIPLVILALSPLARVLWTISESLKIINHFMGAGSALEKWDKYRKGKADTWSSGQAARVTKAGEDTRVFMREILGLSPEGNTISGEELLRIMDAEKRKSSQNINNTTIKLDVHSNATDNEEVATIVIDQIERVINQASLQTSGGLA